MRNLIILAALLAVAGTAQAQQPVTLEPINVTSSLNYTVQTYRGLFGETQAKAIGADGVAYVVPGSYMERGRAISDHGSPTPGNCPDGNPRRYPYHMFGGGDICAAGRPQ